MSTTQTTNLGLTKATPGTGEPFSTSVVNTNLDTIDSAVGELQDSVCQLSSPVTAAHIEWDESNPGPQLVVVSGSKMCILSFRLAGRIDFGYWENGQWYNVKSWT